MIFFTLAVVARNDNGVIQVWAKLYELCSPLQAEVATVLWAFQIALEKKWVRIIAERDAKICIDSLAPMSSKEKQVHWSISTFIRISLEISKSFLSCNFCWISRDCSGVVMFLLSWLVVLESLFLVIVQPPCCYC